MNPTYRIIYKPRQSYGLPYKVQKKTWWGWKEIDSSSRYDLAEQYLQDFIYIKTQSTNTKYYDAEGHRL